MNKIEQAYFNSCVNRAIFLLNERKKQMEEEGYKFRTCIKYARFNIEQAIINREIGTDMMFCALQFVKSIENREELENGII